MLQRGKNRIHTLIKFKLENLNIVKDLYPLGILLGPLSFPIPGHSTHICRIASEVCITDKGTEEQENYF